MLKYVDWVNLVLYGVFGFLLGVVGIGVLTQPLPFFALLGILVFVDIRSHKKGLDKGVEIVKEVWGIK